MEAACGGQSINNGEEHMSREAMQMALDMLNEIADDVYCDQKLEGVIAVLRQAFVDVDDMSRKRVDEKAKREHEPVCAHGVEKTECDFCQPEQEPMAFDEEENPQ